MQLITIAIIPALTIAVLCFLLLSVPELRRRVSRLERSSVDELDHQLLISDAAYTDKKLRALYETLGYEFKETPASTAAVKKDTKTE